MDTNIFTNSSHIGMSAAITLGSLMAEDRWCAWLVETSPGREKATKVPYASNNQRVRLYEFLLPYDRVAVVARNIGAAGNVGIFLGPLERIDAVLCGIDLDACVDAQGVMADWAKAVIEAVPGAWTELSPSGAGMKLYMLVAKGEMAAVRGALGIGVSNYGRIWKRPAAPDDDKAPGIEAYVGKRWFAVTTGRETLDRAVLGFMDVAGAERVREIGTRVFGGGGDARRISEADSSLYEPVVFGPVGETDSAKLGQGLGLGGTLWKLWTQGGGALAGSDGSDSALAFAIGGELRGLGISRAAAAAIMRSGCEVLSGWADKHDRNGSLKREFARLWSKKQHMENGGIGPLPGPVEFDGIGAGGLPDEPKSIREQLEDADAGTVVALFIRLVAGAGLSEVEKEELAGLVAKKAKISKAAIKKDLKETERKRRIAAGGVWQNLLQRNENGVPLGNLANTMTALRKAPELVGIASYDLMMRSVQINHRVPGSQLGEAGRPQQDNDISEIQEWIQRNGVPHTGNEIVQQAVNFVSAENAFHPVQDYLNALVWDGVPRLDTWLTCYLGAKSQNPTYLNGIGRYFLLSMVNRVMRPGCQCDYMLVLEGPQGELKTSACNVLAGDWFSNSMPSLHGGDEIRIKQHLRGKWLIEIGELSGFKKAEMEDLKQFITRQTEEYIPKYVRNEVNEPRQCVFIGTTNEKTYLKDPTGARRFWPVIIGVVQIKDLIADRDQLLAEAVAIYRKGGPEAQYWPDKQFEREHITTEQDARFVVDAWEEPIVAWLACPGYDMDPGTHKSTPKPPVQRCSTGDIAQQALRLETARQDAVSQSRITSVMTKLGWVVRKDEFGNRRWRRQAP